MDLSRLFGLSDITAMVRLRLVVPATMEMIQKVPLGTFLSLDGSERVMILESMNIEKGKLKVSGISLLPWLDNRFVRTSPNHEDQHWYLEEWNCRLDAMGHCLLHVLCR